MYTIKGFTVTSLEALMTLQKKYPQGGYTTNHLKLEDAIRVCSKMLEEADYVFTVHREEKRTVFRNRYGAELAYI